jgi:hypothetical protein
MLAPLPSAPEVPDADGNADDHHMIAAQPVATSQTGGPSL